MPWWYSKDDNWDDIHQTTTELTCHDESYDDDPMLVRVTYDVTLALRHVVQLDGDVSGAGWRHEIRVIERWRRQTIGRVQPCYLFHFWYP